MSLHIKLQEHLDRGVVGFPTALATAVGLVMASPVILTVTSGFGIGGATFVMAMTIAFVLMMCQATTFAEAASLLPTSGSVYDYISCGLGRFFAIAGTLSAYLLVHVFAGTAEVILSGIMATVNFPEFHSMLAEHGLTWLVGVGLVVVFGILNIFGLSFFSKAEIVLTAGMWTTLLIFGVVGVLKAPTVHFDSFLGPSLVGTDFNAVLSLVGMAMFMFLGVEFVTPLAPELKRASRNIPRAMMVGLFMVATCMVFYGTAISRQVENVAVNAQGTVHLLETPESIPVFAEHLMGTPGRIWLGIAFLFAGAATINTLMAGLPRIFYGMALDGALPKAFAYLHPRFKTPVFGIVFTMVIPCLHVWLIKGDVDRLLPLVLAAVCSWGVAYLLVTLSVVMLRIRRPDLPRSFKSPLFPLPQILSSVGILIAIWYIAPPGVSRAAVYWPFGIMVGLTALYAFVWTRFVQRNRLLAPVPVETILEEEFGKQPSHHGHP